MSKNKVFSDTSAGRYSLALYELAEEGSIGTCGGMAMCSSCQCYIISDHKLPDKNEDEIAMLSESFYEKKNSRLGCQLFITPELDGLEIKIAPN